MKPFTTLLFPDTDIFGEHLYPLLLFSAPLYYLQPVENDPEERMPDESDLFIKSGLCQAHTPAPLGADRARFLHLINDIARRKDDYAAQLSSLVMAAMSSGRTDSGGERRSQIISSLFNENKIPTGTDKTVLDLWQARLVLAIAEILGREEAELRQDLQQLDAQEMMMFRSLHGETDSDEASPFAEIEKISAGLTQARPREMKIRFKSWLTLMRAAPLPDVSLWLSPSQDGADQLLNEFDKRSNREALPVLKLALPGRIEASPSYVISRIQDFRHDAADVLGRISADLNRLAVTEPTSPAAVEDLLPSGDGYVNRWNELVDEHFPGRSHGLASLYFYLLPDCDISRLLSLACRTGAAQPTNGLLGIVRR